MPTREARPGKVWHRTWRNGRGSAFAVDYYARDPNTNRWRPHRKHFRTKDEAEAFAARTFVEVEAGTFVADSRSCTVAQAGQKWIEKVTAKGRERSTLNYYRNHVELHINPRLGAYKLTELTLPIISEFEDRLRAGVSPQMVLKVMGSLRRLLANAQARGLIGRNVARDMPRDRGSSRDKRRLKVGVDLPTIEEVRLILHTAQGRWRPLLIVAAFTGLRSSELRAIRWVDLELTLPIGKLHVRQRADAWGYIGPPKSKAGYRTIPLSEFVVNTLLQWKKECPLFHTGERDGAGRPVKLLHYVFPNGRGYVEAHSNVINRGFAPIQLAAGLWRPQLDKKGKERLDAAGNPKVRHKYGLHALRHFFCSWLLDRGKPIKEVQEQMGHDSAVMTWDRYGHLLKRTDDAAEMAAADRDLLGPAVAGG